MKKQQWKSKQDNHNDHKSSTSSSAAATAATTKARMSKATPATEAEASAAAAAEGATTNVNVSSGAPPPPLPSIFVAPDSASAASGPGGVVTVTVNTNVRTNNGGSISNVDTFHRAVHKIRLSALAHNYHEVESAAGRQQCSVIVVVKADGYGHGAIQTALFLADTVGADCFAVATLEEAVALRRAFAQTAPTAEGGAAAVPGHPQTIPGGVGPGAPSALSGSDDLTSFGPPGRMSFSRPRQAPRRSLRQAHIRIIVLGPPVGFPRCFDDYYHHNIECMISGPEVASALLEWVLNTDERRRTQVERAAAEAKERILHEASGVGVGTNPVVTKQAKVAQPILHSQDSNVSESGSSIGGGDSNTQTSGSERSAGENGNGTNGGGHKLPSATLSNVTGSDLAREVREILKIQHKSQQLQQQQHLKDRKQSQYHTSSSNGTASSGDGTPPTTISSTVTPSASAQDLAKQVVGATVPVNGPIQVFGGIEEAAKYSRTRHKAMTSEVFVDSGDDDEGEIAHSSGLLAPAGSRPVMNKPQHPPNAKNDPNQSSMPINKNSMPPRHPQQSRSSNVSFAVPFRRRLRWHALVDSGMGRLGFRTDPVTKEEQGKRRDSVEIIHELVQLEQKLDSPVEFFGMCTHMADANSTSTYTQSQMQRFKTLLKRVRAAGIFIPTISSDNSAALLTENLTHFDPEELLKQADANSRGFVRTGGAIYGQRPSFSQLHAVSTLMASVRHVAVLKKGESVGYDRAYVAPIAMRIATLTIGFADGYPRELGNGVGKVSIRGHLFPVAGNVCMDMLMVELGPAGDRTGPGAQVVVGDTAILWGPDDGEFGEGHVRLQDLAGILKTTQSALTCGLNKERVLRQYS